MKSTEKQEEQVSFIQMGAAVGKLNEHFAKYDLASIAELKNMLSNVETINSTKAAMSLDTRGGFIFEELHAGTFNAAARKAGDFTTTAVTGGSGGFFLDKRVDIRVVGSGKVLMEAQAKCCGTASRTAIAVSKPQYAGTQRIVPEDQLRAASMSLTNSAKAKANSQNARMQQIGINRQEAADKLRDKLDAAGHQSRPVTHSEAIDIASGNTSSLSRAIAADSIRATVVSSAKSGLMVSGTISAVTNISKLATGKVSVAEAAVTVAKETLKGGAQSVVIAAAAEAVKVVAKKVLPATAAKILIRGSVPLAVAGCIVEIVTDTYKGKLTAQKVARSVGKTTGGWVGAEAGAAAGTMILPGVGTVVGAVIGGIGGSLLVDLW